MKTLHPKNARLYHYTQTFETLSRHIFREGFWPQYSLEDFSWIQDDSPLYLAFPCVCFTQLELERSAEHRDDYGNYAIGFHREWEGSRLMQPLRYIAGQNTSFLMSQHRHALQSYGPLDRSTGHFHPARLNPEDFDEVWKSLPYIKENMGFTLQRRAQPLGSMTHVWLLKRLKDEDEWRHIPAKHRDRLFSVHDYGSRTMSDLNEESIKTHDSHLRFELSDVAIVIVTTAHEREQLTAEYPKLAGKVRIWTEVPESSIERTISR